MIFIEWMINSWWWVAGSVLFGLWACRVMRRAAQDARADEVSDER